MSMLFNSFIHFPYFFKIQFVERLYPGCNFMNLGISSKLFVRRNVCFLEFTHEVYLISI